MSGNQALNINAGVGQQADLAITTHGSDWYFTVSAIMTVSALAFTALSSSKPIGQRVFHQVAAGFCFVAAIGYWTAASGLGQVPIRAQFPRADRDQVSGAGTREIFYVRYIDWAVSMPLAVLAVLLSSGVPGSTMLATMLAAEIFNVCLLVGALTQSSYKWGYLAFAMAAQWFVFYQLLVPGRRWASAIGGGVYNTYLGAALLTVAAWFLLPVAWSLSEGGNYIHPDSEAIWYGILDIFAKPVLGFLLVFGHRSTDFASIGFPAREPGSARSEKSAAAAAAADTGATNGAGAA